MMYIPLSWAVKIQVRPWNHLSVETLRTKLWTLRPSFSNLQKELVFVRIVWTLSKLFNTFDANKMKKKWSTNASTNWSAVASTKTRHQPLGWFDKTNLPVSSRKGLLICTSSLQFYKCFIYKWNSQVRLSVL